MPRLSCWTCGRLIYTVSPIGSLFPEERRCPRCGAFLNADRREAERRVLHRRVNPTDDPGPPKPKGKPNSGGTDARPPAGAIPEGPAPGERRVADRRTVRRRGGSTQTS
jgi:hypothetical protein